VCNLAHTARERGQPVRSSRLYAYLALAAASKPPPRPAPPAPPPQARGRRRPPVPVPRPVLSARQLARLPLAEVEALADQGDVRCQLFLAVAGGCGPRGGRSGWRH
jgi:hypothetical protein